MKCVVAQYLIAMASLKRNGYSPLRTIRLSFVPDEEIGGVDGMKILISSKWFSEISIAIALDEVRNTFQLTSIDSDTSFSLWSLSVVLPCCVCCCVQGLASEDEHYSIFYGERLPWWLKVTATGNTGHASRLVDGTAVKQVMGVINRAMRFRKRQYELLHSKCSHSGGCSHSVAASLGECHENSHQSFQFT